MCCMVLGEKLGMEEFENEEIDEKGSGDLSLDEDIDKSIGSPQKEPSLMQSS